MKKLLLYILFSSNFLLLSSEHGIKYTKNTCHRTYRGIQLSTAEEREEYGECALSRFEAYDEAAGKHIANIAYTPFACRIVYLSVDEKYRKKGIGKELAKRAIEDMRAMHNCREVDLISSSSSEKFWETLGAKPADSFRHVFPEGCVVGQNPSSHLSLDSKQSTKDLAWFYDQYATVI